MNVISLILLLFRHDEENTLSTNPFMDAVVKNIEKHLDDSTFEAKVLADSLNMSLQPV